MKTSGLHMPAHFSAIENESLSSINGGGSFLSFISYILSGFQINFGSGKDYNETDTTITTHGGSTPSGGNVVSIGTGTDHSYSYGNWNASFNLGSFFNALVRLFR